MLSSSEGSLREGIFFLCQDFLGLINDFVGIALPLVVVLISPACHVSSLGHIENGKHTQVLQYLACCTLSSLQIVEKGGGPCMTRV